MPCPISACDTINVIVLSGVIRTQDVTQVEEVGVADCVPCICAANMGNCAPINSPPPTNPDTLKKSRRVLVEIEVLASGEFEFFITTLVERNR